MPDHENQPRGQMGTQSGDHGQHHRHDPQYHAWRERQNRQFDEDWDAFNQERQKSFDDAFDAWRMARTAGRQATAASGNGDAPDRTTSSGLSGTSSATATEG